ncbi:hypothetical protein F2P81_021735 [Scophthalmus maximus]|uniref:Uncharacterized protein n=1 Tax=Scophthalmus maximus TaxID=52904 RepID=A0A6A4S497_SCOMX|nr:hypothetical protein F2P81_021735 [Scophthalmus maximus]
MVFFSPQLLIRRCNRQEVIRHRSLRRISSKCSGSDVDLVLQALSQSVSQTGFDAPFVGPGPDLGYGEHSHLLSSPLLQTWYWFWMLKNLQ